MYYTAYYLTIDEKIVQSNLIQYSTIHLPQNTYLVVAYPNHSYVNPTCYTSSVQE